jgi:hypothetical protein
MSGSNSGDDVAAGAASSIPARPSLGGGAQRVLQSGSPDTSSIDNKSEHSDALEYMVELNRRASFIKGEGSALDDGTILQMARESMGMDGKWPPQLEGDMTRIENTVWPKGVALTPSDEDPRPRRSTNFWGQNVGDPSRDIKASEDTNRTYLSMGLRDKEASFDSHLRKVVDMETYNLLSRWDMGKLNQHHIYQLRNLWGDYKKLRVRLGLG